MLPTKRVPSSLSQIREPSQLSNHHPPLVKPGQNFAVIAYVPSKHLRERKEPETDGKEIYSPIAAISFLGSFSTGDEASDWCKSLHAKGFDLFNLHVVTMNVFVPLPPPMFNTDRKFTNEIMKDIFQSHHQNAMEAERILDERVQQDRKECKNARDIMLSAPGASASAIEEARGVLEEKSGPVLSEAHALLKKTLEDPSCTKEKLQAMGYELKVGVGEVLTELPKGCSTIN